MNGTYTEPAQAAGKLFTYEPLVERHDIRLLKLEKESGTSGDLNDRIAGILVQRSLDDLASAAPTCTYYALSYTWGNPAPSDRLWLSEGEYLPITASAAHALRCLTRDDYLWIDSICINQADEKEKSTQLMFMWGIYKYAKQVLAWLGDADDDGELAMQLLFDTIFSPLTEELTGRAPVALPTASIESLPRFRTALWRHNRPPVPADFNRDPERWLALARFLDRPWWHRAWVIQEVVAARDVTIMMNSGSRRSPDAKMTWKVFNDQTRGYIVKWDKLVEVIEHLQSWRFTYLLEMADKDASPCNFPIYPAALESIRRVEILKSAREDKRLDFQDNLLLTKVAEASDYRDKVFAIGSMSHGSLAEELVPNYNHPVVNVFINATRYLLVRDQYLMILHVAGLGWPRNIKGLPSWVPDFSITRRTGTRHGSDFVLGEKARSAMFAAGSNLLSDTAAEVKILGSWRLLIRIRGVIVDNVAVVCSGLPPNRSIQRSMDSEHWLDRTVIRSWLNNVRSQVCPGTLSNTYLGRSTTKPLARNKKTPLSSTYLLASALSRHIKQAPTESDALASALIVGSSCDGHPMSMTNIHTPLDTMYETFNTCLEKDIRPCESSESAETQNGLNAYLTALDRLPSWTVFRTASGYIGRGPKMMREGDRICVFQGARTPFVVRKVKMPCLAPATFYHLVGECYVEGLMAKEASRISPWKWGLITLY